MLSAPGQSIDDRISKGCLLIVGHVDGSKTGSEARSRGFKLTCCVGEVCFSRARRDLCDTRDSNAMYLRRVDSKTDSLQALAGSSLTLRCSNRPD